MVISEELHRAFQRLYITAHEVQMWAANDMDYLEAVGLICERLNINARQYEATLLERLKESLGEVKTLATSIQH